MNLLEEVNGKLPEDKGLLLAIIDCYPGVAVAPSRITLIV
jgi:hypothetical protein